MTPSETCRAISELLEPNHLTPHGFTLSQRGCWTRDRNVLEWLPLDWHSPGGSFRLLALMPAPVLRDDGDLWCCRPHMGACIEYGGPSPYIAVAEACLLWLQSLSPAGLEAVRERIGEGL